MPLTVNTLCTSIPVGYPHCLLWLPLNCQQINQYLPKAIIITCQMPLNSCPPAGKLITSNHCLSIIGHVHHSSAIRLTEYPDKRGPTVLGLLTCSVETIFPSLPTRKIHSLSLITIWTFWGSHSKSKSLPVINCCVSSVDTPLVNSNSFTSACNWLTH